LKEKSVKAIHNREMRMMVVGSGYVGLPTAALFADAGFQVTAVDVKPEIVKDINEGLIKAREPGLNELVLRNVKEGRLKATSNLNADVGGTNIFIVCVQTPIDKHKRPDLSSLEGALQTIGGSLKKENIVVCGSTVPPQIMLRLVKPRLELLSGLIAGTDFYLAYAPERIAPRKALEEFVRGPRLVGGIEPNSTRVVAELFRTVCKRVVETDALTAEVAKLAENTFRDVNIAFANQLALMCEQLGADVIEVIRLANTHSRVNVHMPGPGVGGPCLPKDPYLLLSSAEYAGYDLVKVARQINDFMPKHVVKLVLQALINASKDVRTSNIAILGTAYKADVDDPRLSPAAYIIDQLKRLRAEVVVYDPQCDESFGAKKGCSLLEVAKGADCLVVITDHTEFKSLNLQEIKKLMKSKPIIIDGRRIVNCQAAENLGFSYYAIGLMRMSCTSPSN
jgi:UDP-N-acetyl-D-mannosaminuronic acid dehydrogenase